jgi:hypothetical protein
VITPDGSSEDDGHSASAQDLVRAAGDALRGQDIATASALTGLAQVRATLALAEVQQELLWVASDIRNNLELLRLGEVGDISRALRERSI